MRLKIIFFIFAALAGLALIGSLWEEADNHSRNRNRESGFHGPYGFPKTILMPPTDRDQRGYFIGRARSLNLYRPTSY
jgi:hypothetical protein